MYNDPFKKAQRTGHGAMPLMTGGDAETWGENKHGYFSFTSAKFISKEDAGDYFMEPCIDIAWPGESTEKEEE